MVKEMSGGFCTRQNLSPCAYTGDELLEFRTSLRGIFDFQGVAWVAQIIVHLHGTLLPSIRTLVYLQHHFYRHLDINLSCLLSSPKNESGEIQEKKKKKNELILT